HVVLRRRRAHVDQVPFVDCVCGRDGSRCGSCVRAAGRGRADRGSGFQTVDREAVVQPRSSGDRARRGPREFPHRRGALQAVCRRRSGRRLPRGGRDPAVHLSESRECPGPGHCPEPPSAFSDAECDAVRDWVRAGGSLLLIADHTPFGATAFALAQRFGVEMGKGYAWTPDEKREPSTTVTYARGSGLATNHPITRGLRRVVAFTGQSLSVPKGATALLTFGDVAYESTAANGESDVKAFREGKPFQARKITGRAQALAFAFGKGRVVMTGEAAMFSAQVVRFTDQGKRVEFKMGMNVPGNDNQQFLLNIMRWLTS